MTGLFRQKYLVLVVVFGMVALLLGGIATVALAGNPDTPRAASELVSPDKTTDSTDATPVKKTAGKKKPKEHLLNKKEATILGVVEGLTEYLPVSSTGHLLIAQHLMHIDLTDADKKKQQEKEDAMAAYEVVIQAGAILAVLLLYFGRIRKMFAGIFGHDKDGRKLAINLIAAFIPAAVIGLAFEKHIKEYLFGVWAVWVVIVAWLVGGVVILFFARRHQAAQGENPGKALEDLTWKQAFGIGILQCFALWPGVSRSLTTIIGGLLAGLSTAAAVEFSFLLGLTTLGAATLYEGIKFHHVITKFIGLGPASLGFVMAAIAAFISVKWMVGYLNRHNLSIFGWYRLAIGAGFAILIALNLLKI